MIDTIQWRASIGGFNNISVQSVRNACIDNAKQKQLGCKKSARPIRSSIVNSCMRPKSLISVKAKKFSLG